MLSPNTCAVLHRDDGAADASSFRTSRISFQFVKWWGSYKATRHPSSLIFPTDVFGYLVPSPLTETPPQVTFNVT